MTKQKTPVNGTTTEKQKSSQVVNSKPRETAGRLAAVLVYPGRLSPSPSSSSVIATGQLVSSTPFAKCDATHTHTDFSYSNQIENWEENSSPGPDLSVLNISLHCTVVFANCVCISLTDCLCCRQQNIISQIISSFFLCRYIFTVSYSWPCCQPKLTGKTEEDNRVHGTLLLLLLSFCLMCFSPKNDRQLWSEAEWELKTAAKTTATKSQLCTCHVQIVFNLPNNSPAAAAAASAPGKEWSGKWVVMKKVHLIVSCRMGRICSLSPFLNCRCQNSGAVWWSGRGQSHRVEFNTTASFFACDYQVVVVTFGVAFSSSLIRLITTQPGKTISLAH